MSFKRINFHTIENIEKPVLDWICVRRFRIPLFFLTILLLLVFSKAPYVNLFFNYYLIILITSILTPFILDIEDRFFFMAAVVFLILTLFLWFYDRDIAGNITNYTLIILISAVLRIFSSR